jgi:ribosomal protein S12 methylthiotransferase
MKKVALISLGCAKNLVDSEVMLGFLQQSGYTFVTDTQKADVVIVNTCGFIQPAKDEANETLANAVKTTIKVLPNVICMIIDLRVLLPLHLLGLMLKSQRDAPIIVHSVRSP